MSDQQVAIQEIQPIIEKIFPIIKEIPVNSISSSIYGTGEERYIYFLIVGDDTLVTPFIKDTKDEAKVKTVTSAVKTVNKVDYDLVFDFSFHFWSGKAFFKITYQASAPEIQKQYLEALKNVEKFRFIIADSDRDIKKVVEINWDSYKNRKVLQKIEKMNAHLQ